MLSFWSLFSEIKIMVMFFCICLSWGRWCRRLSNQTYHCYFAWLFLFARDPAIIIRHISCGIVLTHIDRHYSQGLELWYTGWSSTLSRIRRFVEKKLVLGFILKSTTCRIVCIGICRIWLVFDGVTIGRGHFDPLGLRSTLCTPKKHKNFMSCILSTAKNNFH